MMSDQTTSRDRQCSEKCESGLRACLNAGNDETYCRIESTQCQIGCPVQ